MSALLSAEAVTIITHVRIDIFVSDRRLLIGNADLVKRLYSPRFDMIVVTTVLLVS